MTKYEYKLLRIDYAPHLSMDHDTGVMNQHGEDGWELIQVLGPLVIDVPQNHEQAASLVYVLKRQRD